MKFKVLLDYAIENHYCKTSDNAYLSVMKLLSSLYEKELLELTYSVIEKLKSELKNSGLSNSTINSALSMISVCYDVASISEDKIFKGINLNKPKILKLNVLETKKYTQPLEQDKRQCYCQYALDNNMLDFYHFLIIAYGTMLRINEIQKINDSSIDFYNNEITIYKTKNKKPHTVAMNAAVRKSILSMRPRYFQDYSYRQIFYWFEKAEKALQLGHFTPHSTRHAGASALRRGGVDKSIVKEAGNWSNEQIIENYTHVASKELRQAFDLLQDTF